MIVRKLKKSEANRVKGAVLYKHIYWGYRFTPQDEEDTEFLTHLHFCIERANPPDPGGGAQVVSQMAKDHTLTIIQGDAMRLVV